jgi:hypothetical protein
MNRSGTNKPLRPRSVAGVADARDLRAVIAESLADNHIDEQALRRGVWTYVGAERHAGTSPGHVIMTLNELVDAAKIEPLSARHALTRRVILWCVEAYFGHLGGDVVGRGDEALSDSAVSVSDI